MQQQPQQVVRRGPPPKFRPFMIIVVVMSLGLLFVGMTLTIIAHWPGYTAIGNNPLKIVGPVLLSVGGVVFIGCIAEVVRKSQSDKESFTRQMQERERMMSFVNRTQSQASLGRSVQYAPVPQHPPPIQTGPLYYEGGAYPPPNNNYQPAPDNPYPQPNLTYPGPADSTSGYPGEEDEVFAVATSSRAPSVAQRSVDDSMQGHDMVDGGYYANNEEDGRRRSEAGVIIPEPVRPTAASSKNRTKARTEPETDAERARRERKEKKRRLKEMQASNEALN